jgi:cytochrome c-type biogenesis protein CcmH
MLSRRQFLVSLGVGATTVASSRVSAASLNGEVRGQGSGAGGQSADSQQQGAPQDANGVRTTMSGPMNDGAYKPVQLPGKAGAAPSMSAAARDELEHHLHCQCGCTLDVYTCRTTDFTCPISPAMHQDVMHLVEGGYTGPEIISAFRAAYGERVLMAPVREGFNWAAYIAPFVAIGGGAALVAILTQRWRHAADDRTQEYHAARLGSSDVQATPEEMARLEAAIRKDAP